MAAVLATLLLAAGIVGSAPAQAETNLDGAWSGNGSVVFPSGAKESARCRANFKRRGTDKYLVSARCASASGKVDQTATLTDVGGNRYSGSFFNAEFKIDGTITVTISGDSGSVAITSPVGSSAYFRLTR
jgi:hypothetical protein